MDFSIFEVTLSVFFTALIVSVLFRRLKLSVILGYLVVGAIVGPHALALVHNSDFIYKLAEFGIVFLMFTVGLEFSISKLYALRKVVFLVGGLQVLLCVLVPTLLGTSMGMSVLAALVTGSIVAMSSTALVVKQLNDQIELQAPHGLNAVAILLFQDLAVIPLIILISSLAKGSQIALAYTLFWALLKGLFAIFTIFILGRWLLRPLFHFISKAGAIELFTLTVLLVTLTAAWITESLGLSYALGAFLAGIMLAETEFRHQIEIEIRPFRDMLLALFFITVGMLTNIKDWQHTWHWILLLVLAIIIGKMIIITLLSRLAGNYYSTATRTGIVLAQGGEFGFAILSLAMSHDILSYDYQQVILAALLISIAIAPLLIRFNKKIVDFILPKNNTLHAAASQNNIIEEAKKLHHHVIICGYGRVGQHIARILNMVNLPYMAIDVDADLVQSACLAGDNVIYGDAAHPDILRMAGIDQAKVLVISLSDHRAALKTLSILQPRYPNLPILVRCHDKAELTQLKGLGATKIIAELFEASLTISKNLLKLMKLPEKKISDLIRELRNTDYEILQQVFAGSMQEEAVEDTTITEQLAPIVIPENAYAVNHKISELKLNDLNIKIVLIRRGKDKITKPRSNMIILANDIVVLFGSLSNLELAERRLLEGV